VRTGDGRRRARRVRARWWALREQGHGPACADDGRRRTRPGTDESAATARQQPLRPETMVRRRDDGARTNGPRAGYDRTRAVEGAGLDRVMRRRPGGAIERRRRCQATGARCPGAAIERRRQGSATSTRVPGAANVDDAGGIKRPGESARRCERGRRRRDQAPRREWPRSCDQRPPANAAPAWRKRSAGVVRRRPSDATERCPPACEHAVHDWSALRSHGTSSARSERESWTPAGFFPGT